MAEKMRVHILAKELNVTSKTILQKCKAEGLDTAVKNHMSTLSAGLYATIREWFSEGTHSTTIEVAERIDLKKVRKKTRKKAVPKKEAPEPATDEAPSTESAEATPVVEAVPVEATVAAGPMVPAPDVDAAPPTEPLVEATPAVAVAAQAPQEALESTTVAAEAPATAAATGAPVAPVGEAPESAKAEGIATEPVKADPTSLPPAGPQNVPEPVKLKGPRVVRYEAPDRDVFTPRPSPPRRPPSMLPSEPPRPGVPGPGRAPGDNKDARRSRVNPRRSVNRLSTSTERLAEWRDRDLAERKERLAGATGRRIHRRKSTGNLRGQTAVQEAKTKAKVHEPVRMKEFCFETGLNFMQCFRVLREQHQMMPTINTALPTDVAQLLALEFGIELEVVPARTLLDTLKEKIAARSRDNLVTRPPVVTMLGHVDHGKTSLLDAVRSAGVVKTEDGGITQHIGAYHVIGEHGAVTFLDTPGHKAFSAMRARGAKLTDVVVLVVAADDGVMPQTIEAINHAKSAEVTIVVALNKIDLGDHNLLKIYGQLSEHGLTPSGDWGGEIDVVKTAATTGEGVDELVAHLVELSDLMDLKADPTVPAVGTVIEAETKTGVGPVVRVLVQDGTLRVGDPVVCGNASGKVRALLDDRGQRLTEAGPSIPVEVWGLDDVPLAGDGFYCVDTLQEGKSIAGEVRQTRLEKSRLQSRKVLSLEELFRQRDSEDRPELNLILKCDVDGSVEVLKQSLAEIPSDEIKLTIRHAGVGAPTDSDVMLASACNGIVVSYRVEAPALVRKLADQHGVEIRPYRVVYDVNDDIKKALEGLLTPEEHIERRATAEVRNIFRVSKVGMVAGCYVTDGTIQRSHLMKVIRDGVLVREGCVIGSLKRFKDDVKEVRNGMECGVRLEGFDDVHEGDVLEAYEIVKVARTL